mmetsp:Transcript_55908/g.84606  ORF Transcript_55908/g.84606 Transcript_55908/m.84606 type:complete len:413 (+) Transcript_55908:93-1331(+)
MVAKDDGENKKFDKKVDALEMEMLNPPGGASTSSSSSSGKAFGASEISQTIDRYLTLARLYMELYPRATKIIGALFGILMFKWIFLRHRGQSVYVPPHLARHYGSVQSYYDLQIAKIDHWCLMGGDDDCVCDDPTEELSRPEVSGWTSVFEQNKRVAAAAPRDIDVVFLGDEFTQAWTGMKMTKPVVGGTMITTFFNQTFQKDKGGTVNGIALGIYGDTTANLLFRINHGEVPDTLNPKVWWILIGANDLVRGQCSEEAVVVGILRLADEIAMKKPGSIVVIQGLLPRSSFSDGALSHSHSKSTVVRSSTKEYYKPNEYPLWPSIKAINTELENFCAQHEHMVYFDTSSLFFGSLGNEHFQSSQKIILKELMPDFAHPSAKGYQILAKVIGNEVNDIIYDNDESNQKVGGTD